MREINGDYMKLRINAKNLIRTFAVTTVAILICASPVMGRSFYFIGKLDNGKRVIGVWDNNHGDTCIKLGNSWVIGTVENDHGIPNSDPMRFHTEKIINKTKKGTQVRNYRKFLRIKALDSGTKRAFFREPISEADFDALINNLNSCDYMFSDEFYNRKRNYR
jgi:hypothetical protein